MKNLLRAATLLALLLATTACPTVQEQTATTNRAFMPVIQEEPSPTPTPYEDPGDCECVRDEMTGRVVCNSACTGRPK